jgi:hypothetical protein
MVIAGFKTFDFSIAVGFSQRLMIFNNIWALAQLLD